MVVLLSLDDCRYAREHQSDVTDITKSPIAVLWLVAMTAVISSIAGSEWVEPQSTKA